MVTMGICFMIIGWGVTYSYLNQSEEPELQYIYQNGPLVRIIYDYGAFLDADPHDIAAAVKAAHESAARRDSIQASRTIRTIRRR